MSDLRDQWYEATSNLLPGEQAVFRDVLALVAEEKKQNLIWGSDYGDDGANACLVNAAGSMLSKGDGQGIPSSRFGDVVSLYDQINRDFRDKGVNTDYHVSPLAAEILLQWFAPQQKMPEPTEPVETNSDEVPYIEKSDEALHEALMQMLSEPDAPVDTVDQITPFDDCGSLISMDERNADF